MRTKKTWPPRIDSEDTRTKAFNYAVKYLSFRIRSVKEVYDYLLRKNFVEESINPTLKRLIDMKFLSDEEFARTWIASRQKYKGKSKLILKSELRLKGVNNEIIDSLLRDAIEDIEAAKIAYQKKKRILSNLPKEEFNKKMTAYLARKGFSWGVISKLLKEV